MATMAAQIKAKSNVLDETGSDIMWLMRFILIFLFVGFWVVARASFLHRSSKQVWDAARIVVCSCCIVSQPIKWQVRKFFLVKDHLWIYPQSLIQSYCANITGKRIGETSHAVNRFLFIYFYATQAGTMPCCKQKSISRKYAKEKTRQNIGRIWQGKRDIPSLYRYITI